MDSYALPISPHYETAIFNGSSATAGTSWLTWTRPMGKSYAQILVIGGGGGGGSGVVGAASTAAGGGGGGSGGMTSLFIPLYILPNRLYISVAGAKTGAGLASYVAVQPNTTVSNTIAYANGGAVGGNGSGATGGPAGAGGTLAVQSSMPLGWMFASALAGEAGGVGGTTAAGGAVNLPATGLRVTGGTGGGGLPASGTGSIGGGITIPGGFSYYPSQLGGVGPISATQPANNGSNGFNMGMGSGNFFYYGGAGGSSTYVTATGAGLVQGAGGNGAVGSGGGGSGGAVTSSAAASASYGGPGLVMITCF